MQGSRGTVIVSVPQHGCKGYVRRAVLSVLAQTYRDLRVVVVNDGDGDSPWGELVDLSDPRLIRCELPQSHGPYFITEAVLGAGSSEYLLIQDADDWSEPDRISTLFDLLDSTGRGAANSGHYVDTVDPSGSPREEDLTDRFTRPIGTDFIDRTRHHGLYKTGLLRSVGGYFGGFRVEYDRFIGNMLHLIGELDYTPRPLYHRSRRPGSLTLSSSTGHGSAYRADVHAKLEAMYLAVLAESHRGNADLRGFIRQVSQWHVQSSDRRYLAECSLRIGSRLARPSVDVLQLPDRLP
jgi:glycosyltransferase involved in cell wall biosynthesis